MRWRMVLAGSSAVVFLSVASSSVGVCAVSAPQVVGSSTSSSGGITTMSGMPVPEAAAFGTGAISGVITDGTTGLPLEGVLVSLGGGRPGPTGRPQQVTDARGRFVFTHLIGFPDYTVSAAKLGYLDGGYKLVPGLLSVRRIALRDGEWLPKADVQLWRTASIAGSVLDDQGDPVVGVPVRLLMKVRVAGRIRQAAGSTTTTDDRGMYRLSGLSPGEYIIHVPSVQVTIPEAPVTPRPPSAPATAGSGVTSVAPDPDGVVRAEPGLGLVVGFFATPPAGGGAAAYAMAFHPAARSMDAATPVSIEYGDQRQNVDVQLMLLPTVRVSGRLLGSPDLLAKVPVRLVPVGSEGLALGAEAAFTSTGAQGEFTFLRVPSGDYTLIAGRAFSEFNTGNSSTISNLLPGPAVSISSYSSGQVPGSNGVMFTTRSTPGGTVAGRVSISVGDKDVDDLAVTLLPGVTVSGQFVWDGAEAPPAGARLDPFVRLEPADGDLSLGIRTRTRRQDETGTGAIPFTVEGVLPGRYQIGDLSAGSFSLEAIEWRGRDLIATPLEVEEGRDVTGVVIRMTSKPIKVSGSVRDANGPATSGAVIAFPAAPALWRNFGLTAVLFKTGSIVADGTYRLDRMVPGEYLLVAVPDEDRSKWVDPEYLASIAGSATRIELRAGSTVTQSLQMIGGGR